MREIKRERIFNITDELLDILSSKQVSLEEAEAIAGLFAKRVEESNEINMKRYIEKGPFQRCH